LSIAAAALALAWLIVLVSLPWNLYFAARRGGAGMVVSRRRGIAGAEAEEGRGGRNARRLLWFALGGHVRNPPRWGWCSFCSRDTVGYYFTGSYLLSATIRPAAAYFGHLRERIGALSRETRHPRDDVVSLREKVDRVTDAVKVLQHELPHARQALTDDLRR